jgi:hypothetical protein
LFNDCADNHAWPDSATSSNLAATRPARLGLGHRRDVSVIVIDGEVEVLEIDALPEQRGDRFAGVPARRPTR